MLVFHLPPGLHLGHSVPKVPLLRHLGQDLYQVFRMSPGHQRLWRSSEARAVDIASIFIQISSNYRCKKQQLTPKLTWTHAGVPSFIQSQVDLFYKTVLANGWDWRGLGLFAGPTGSWPRGQPLAPKSELCQCLGTKDESITAFNVPGSPQCAEGPASNISLTHEQLRWPNMYACYEFRLSHGKHVCILTGV